MQWRRTCSTAENPHLQFYNIKDQTVVIEENLNPTEKETQSKGLVVFSREKRNPLLEKVKNTKLSCFASSKPTGSGLTDLFDEPSASYCNDSEYLIGNPRHYNQITKNKAASFENLVDGCEYPPRNKLDQYILERNRRTPDFQLLDREKPSYISPSSVTNYNKPTTLEENSVSSSYFTNKLKTMSEKYFKSSTNRFLAKLYKNNSPNEQCHTNRAIGSKSPSKAKLRSFSYGALPGMEEFQKQQNSYQYEDEELDKYFTVPHRNESGQAFGQDEDNDSGILVNTSANSSVVGCMGNKGNFRDEKLTVSHVRSVSQDNAQESDYHNLRYFYNDSRPLASKAKIGEVVQRSESDVPPPLPPHQKMFSHNDRENRGKSFILTRLIRSEPNENLGICIAKMGVEVNQGYVIAHIVPGSLADRYVPERAKLISLRKPNP